MSLIEEALRKSAQQREAAARGVPPPRPVRAAASAAAPAAVSTPAAHAAASAAAPQAETPARQYRLAVPDPQAMERNHVVLGVSDPTVMRAYKILRTRVLQRMRANNWNTLGITGAAAGEGKTLTAINVAITLAQEVNTWVFLVDLDLQRPQVGNYLGLQHDFGLTDYLAGQVGFEEVVYDTGLRRLAVVPNARSIEHSSEYLSSPAMAEFLRMLEADSPRRIIVFDLPPLLVSDDVLAFAPHLDALLLVVSQGQTARRTLSNAREVLAEMNLLGVVLNRSTERNDSPYY